MAVSQGTLCGRAGANSRRNTGVSVLLKEEATRVRLSEEMHRKRDNRKLWTQLKERPIYAQRQYCLW